LQLRSGPDRLEPSTDLPQPAGAFEPGERHRPLTEGEIQSGRALVECSWISPALVDDDPIDAAQCRTRVERRLALTPRIEPEPRQHIVGPVDRPRAAPAQA